MSTQLRVTTLPPVQFSAFESRGTTPPPHNGHIRRHERELYGLEKWEDDSKPKAQPQPKAESETEKMMSNTRRRIRNMSIDSTRRQLKRAQARLDNRNATEDHRQAALALRRIIDG